MLTKSEELVVRAVMARLAPADTTHVSAEVLEALKNPYLRAYLDTWVIPALRCTLRESRDIQQAWRLSRR